MQYGCSAVLTVGGCLRLRQYFAHRALWLDELQLSLNIVHRSYGGLLHPLGSDQAAPVGWLWAEKTAIEAFGSSDNTLRIVPLLLSLVSLALFFVVVRRWLVGVAQIVACALFALSPDLINYATQVKQYGSDVCFVLVVVVLTTRVDDGPTKRTITLWATLSILAMWCSHAAAIALASCTLVLLARMARRSRSDANGKAALRSVMAVSIAFAASFGTEYVVNLRSIAGNPVLRAYWKRGLPPARIGVGSGVTWLWHALLFLMTNPLRFASPRLALVLFLVGGVLFVAGRGAGALIVVAPLGAAIVLSLAGRYPLYERLALYLAPLVFVSMAALGDLRKSTGLAPLAMAGLVAVLFVSARPMGRAVSVAWRPTNVTDSRGPFAFVAAHWQPGDALYVESRWAVPAYKYYGPHYHLHDNGTFGFTPMPQPCVVDSPFKALRTYRRVWFVLTHHSSREPLDRNAIYRSYFAAIGRPLAEFYGAGYAGAFLYTVGPPHVAAPARPTWVEHGCLSLRKFRTASS